MAGDSIRVNSGDTLAKIAKQYGVTVKELAEANGIKNIDVLQINQELKIPGAELEHTGNPEMTEEEFLKRMEQNEQRIKDLESRSVASQLKEEVSEAVSETVNDVKEWGAEKYGQAKETVRAAGEYVSEKAEAAWEGTKDAAKAAGEYVADKAEATWEGAKDVAGAVADGAKAAGEYVADKAEAAWEGTKDAAKAAGEYVADKAEAAWDTTKEVATDAAKFAVGAGVVAAEAVADGAKAAWEGVKDVHNAQVELTEDAAKYIADKAKTGAKEFFKDIRADVPKEEVVDTSKMTKEELLAHQEQRIKDLEEQSVVDRATREFKEGYNEVVDGAENIASKIYNGVKDAAKALFNWWKW